ncbi:MAG TPA: LysO family transporter [Clostridia bacterium]|nr:LysO family transporter [Clostridia bacterium]
MINVLIFLFIGIMIGSFANLNKKAVLLNSKLQFFGLMLLLFFMGSSIGMNKSLLSNLKTIGIDSFAYASSAAFFSVLFVYGTTKRFFEGR